jgi:pilus assembly protein Flp/PilA
MDILASGGSWEETEMNDLFLNLYIRFQILMTSEDGQDMVEYALVVAMLALGAVAGARGLAGGLNTAYSNISGKLAANIT